MIYRGKSAHGRMAIARGIVSAIASSFAFVLPVQAQVVTGSISGRVVDSATSRGVVNVAIRVEGGRHSALSREDGVFQLSGLPAGVHTVRAVRLGYAAQTNRVAVTAGETALVDFALVAQAATLSEIVVTGYGTQRREAISGSVTRIDGTAANKGVVPNVGVMLQGRAAGVHVILDNGEPGGGAHVRIRGGTSISASNDPLYVVDGVPLQNEATAPGSLGWATVYPVFARNTLNAINPGDIESITVLKDASATAIYGSRGANGVILIQTKAVASGVAQIEYETYLGVSARARSIGLADGEQFRAYVQQQVDRYKEDSLAGAFPRRGLAPAALTSLGEATTDWEREVSRPGITVSHNLAFSGGSDATKYRASLNHYLQQGILLSTGLERHQVRLNATHGEPTGRLDLGLNMMLARVNNDYGSTEPISTLNGTVLSSMMLSNPTLPVVNADGSYRGTGNTAIDVPNPVAVAVEVDDAAPEHRVLGTFSGKIRISDDFNSETRLGIDYSDAVRRTFVPRSSSAGRRTGFARQAHRRLQNLNFQQLLNYNRVFAAAHNVEVVGGYEFTKVDNRGFEAQMEGFITDAFGVNNLGAGAQFLVPASYRVESMLASFFSRVTYGFAGRYFLSSVFRHDGSSRLAPGHQWAAFPGISASWWLSEEDFLARNNHISTLAVRAGWGRQGNQSVAPYQTQLLMRVDPEALYPFGNVITAGLRAAQVGNPNLTWETVEQLNIGIDYGMRNERFSGVFDFYQKTTRDLLLEVDVPQPAVVSRRLENIGSVRNRGVEATFNARLHDGRTSSLNLEIVASAERNTVMSLGAGRQFINSGWAFGPGHSGDQSQRIMLGAPLGTFFVPHFLRVNDDGQQVFSCRSTSPGCSNGETISPTDQDRIVAGHANPDFTAGMSSSGKWRSFDASWLWRGEFGGKVFNNTALEFRSKGNAKNGKNFLAEALNDPDDINEPTKLSDRWIEDRTFVRLQNVTIGYTLPMRFTRRRTARIFVSGDNLLLVTRYSGYDPESFVALGLAARGIDYLTYPRARTVTLGVQAKL